jgi:hypothetical protein
MQIYGLFNSFFLARNRANNELHIEGQKWCSAEKKWWTCSKKIKYFLWTIEYFRTAKIEEECDPNHKITARVHHNLFFSSNSMNKQKTWHGCGTKKKMYQSFSCLSNTFVWVRRSERILLGQKNPITKQNQ